MTKTKSPPRSFLIRVLPGIGLILVFGYMMYRYYQKDGVRPIGQAGVKKETAVIHVPSDISQTTKRLWGRLTETGFSPLGEPKFIRLAHGELFPIALEVPANVTVNMVEFRFHNIHTTEQKLDQGVMEFYMDGKRLVPTTGRLGDPDAPPYYVRLPKVNWGTHLSLTHDDEQLIKQLTGRSTLFGFRWLDDDRRHWFNAKSFECFLVSE